MKTHYVSFRNSSSTQPLIVSILSERRAIAPYGMAGGECAQKGLNLLLRPLSPEETNGTSDGAVTKKRKTTKDSKDSTSAGSGSIGSGGSFRTVNIGAKSTVTVNPGDRLVILSPGGGGYGAPSTSSVLASSTSTATGSNAPRSNIRISGSLQDYTSMQESV